MFLPKQVLQGGVWQFASVTLRAILQLGILGILARHVSPQEFGLIAIANITISFTRIFSQVGLGPAIIQRKELSSNHLRVGFSLTMLLSCFFFSVIWILAPPIALFFKEESVIPVLKVIGLSFLLEAPGVISESLLERELKFKSLLFINISTYTLGYGCVGIVLALKNFGVWAIVIATLVQILFKTILLLICHPYPMKPLIVGKEIGDLIAFGGGLTLSRIFNIGALQGDYLIVGHFLGVAALGLYERVFRIMLLPVRYFGEALDRVMFPAMSRMQADSEKLLDFYTTSISLVNFFLMPLSALLILVAPELVLILLGSDWMEVVIPLQILLFSISILTSSRMADALVRATGAVYQSTLVKLFYALFVLLFSWLGHFKGITGVVIGVNTAILTNYILMLKLSTVILHCSWRRLLKTSISGLILFIYVLLVGWGTSSILGILNFPAIYIFFLTSFFVLFSVLFLITMSYVTVKSNTSKFLLSPLRHIGLTSLSFLNLFKTSLKHG